MNDDSHRRASRRRHRRRSGRPCRRRASRRARHPPAHLRARRERRRSASRMGRMSASSRPGATTSTRRRARCSSARDGRAPDDDGLPTGGEIVRDYLAPLAALPEIAPNLKLGATVTAITRQGHDKVSNEGRENSPFVIRYEDAGGEHRVLARAVIDASGTWSQPNPIGVDGLPVPGEREAADRIAYGIPDVIGAERERLRRKARARHRRRPFGDQRGAGADGTAAARRRAPKSSGRCAGTASKGCSAAA